MKILDTERLTLRLPAIDDASFVLELVNEPGWLRFIGDRGIRTIDAARDYIVNGPLAMQERYGFCLYTVESKETRAPLGICGLIKRDTLDDVDIGFAFLAKHGNKGYALEAAAAVMGHARDTLGLQRVVAITSPENERSIRLLERLGLRFEKRISTRGEPDDTNLYARDFSAVIVSSP
jgi:RimJ/RimL family protein N-acetyltransferase